MAIDRFRGGSEKFLSRTLVSAALFAAAVLSTGCCKLVPWALAVDPSLSGNSDGNGILEPGETVEVAPSWRKANDGRCKWSNGHLVCTGTATPGEFSCLTNATETGAAGAAGGPAPGDYVLGDTSASYGSFGTSTAGSTRQCTDCYSLFVNAPAARPAAHWDATFAENLTGTRIVAATWKVHVGESFTDVPRTHPFYGKIETLFHNGITSGCAPLAYCPSATVSREQVAVFAAKGVAKGQANIPTSGSVGGEPYNCTAGGVSLYSDVAPTDTACRHVHYVAAQNVMSGCGAVWFCPNRTLSRGQMVVTIAAAMIAPQGEAAIPMTYGPDSTTGLSYSCNPSTLNVHFVDVPAGGELCNAAHYLWARGVIAGCGPDALCADGDVSRDQMAKFLVNAFHLKLYGP